MPTVEEEILFHLQNKDAAIVKTFSDLFGFENLMQTNPFNLSGGEQTILCVFIHLLLSPQKIIIDNTFEQLNKNWRDTLKQFIQTHYSEVEFYISDNRFSEYGWEAQIITPSPKNDYKLVFDMPNFNLNLNYKKEAKKNVFEIKNLFFSYSNRKPIFENSNFRFESGVYHLKGNNGAGKSTLSKIILGIIKAKKAEFHFNSAPIKVYKYPSTFHGYRPIILMWLF
jgi:energy-coupling factor transport system ATP-binding protein